MLKLTGIETFYGTSQALFGMAFSIEKGEVVTLLGRNGMGKTTTINSIMGIVPPAAGTIEFMGVDVTHLASFKTANLGVGLVPEGRQIFPNLTVKENLIATASNHQQITDPWSLEKIFDMFPELAARSAAMGNLLSGGEQQMLAIGRALMTNPQLLILDEATEGLAPLIRAKIWAAISQIRDKGLSILVVDKNVADLIKLADRHVIIEKGKVVWTGTSQELGQQEELQHRYLGV
ncbi:Branched-chain amino acid transport ATP-binding protein LivF (TC 3.A.1.4.1) [hydrothermal vent metagenome]|uniref:Branched-chain amino acid transport ATP-binding protein LivF (TC 3.A.1.4.1) n=1 Tax=hydrothermal vent metagenome TaxID=652676 RepID=A0A3B0RWP3_9ZZZZ